MYTIVSGGVSLLRPSVGFWSCDYYQIKILIILGLMSQTVSGNYLVTFEVLRRILSLGSCVPIFVEGKLLVKACYLPRWVEAHAEQVINQWISTIIPGPKWESENRPEMWLAEKKRVLITIVNNWLLQRHYGIVCPATDFSHLEFKFRLFFLPYWHVGKPIEKNKMKWLTALTYLNW